MAEEDQEMVTQEYSIWKKNTPLLYDLVIAHALEWPSLTAEWLPGCEHRPTEEHTIHRLLLGTHTSEDVQNRLLVAEVRVPDDTVQHPNKDETEKGKGTGIKSSAGKVDIAKQIAHDGEVNRARHCPHNPDMVATKVITGDVCVFDINTAKPNKVTPTLTLKGHHEEGYGLAWSPMQKGYLASSGNDGLVCLWDAFAKSSGSALPLHVFSAHEGVAGDVSWHAKEAHVFASVGDDKKLVVYDTRTKAAVETVEAHKAEINCLSFHPTNEHLLATGSHDHTIGLFDIRNLGIRLHSLAQHENEIYNVGWNPHYETVLASSAADRRLMMWDLSNIGEEQSREDAEDGPPELLFVHSGHTARISDFAWSPSSGSGWMMASVADDNILQVYTPAASALLGS